MYRYDKFDATIVQERVNQFRGGLRPGPALWLCGLSQNPQNVGGVVWGRGPSSQRSQQPANDRALIKNSGEAGRFGQRQRLIEDFPG